MNILGLLQEKYKRTHEGIGNGSSPESGDTTEAPDDELQQTVVELEEDSTSSKMDCMCQWYSLFNCQQISCSCADIKCCSCSVFMQPYIPVPAKLPQTSQHTIQRIMM